MGPSHAPMSEVEEKINEILIMNEGRKDQIRYNNAEISYICSRVSGEHGGC